MLVVELVVSARSFPFFLPLFLFLPLSLSFTTSWSLCPSAHTYTHEHVHTHTQHRLHTHAQAHTHTLTHAAHTHSLSYGHTAIHYSECNTIQTTTKFSSHIDKSLKHNRNLFRADSIQNAGTHCNSGINTPVSATSAYGNSTGPLSQGKVQQPTIVAHVLVSADDARGGSPDANRSVSSNSDARLFRTRQLEQLLLNERRLQSTNLLDGKNQYLQL